MKQLNTRTNKTKRIRIILGIVILILLPLTAIMSWNIGVNHLVNKKEAQIVELNHLLIDLDKEPVDVDIFTSTSPVTLIERTKKYIDLNIEFKKVPEYEERKEDIISIFDIRVDEYISKVSEYSEVDLSFLPQNLEELDFYTKKNPDLYLDTLKSQFKEAVVTYNQNSTTNLYWELDPEVEVSEMTEQEKIGQLVSFPITGISLSESDRQFLEDYNIGSITYFGENIFDENQVTDLSRNVQDLDDRYPNLIAVDQEGGIVERIWWDPVGSHKEIGFMIYGEQCLQWKARSELLRSLGVNWNLGIVADVSKDTNSFIYPRTFSTDYENAGSSVYEAVMCSSLTLSTLKHWPGHGATTVDTHKQLGTLSSTSEDEWRDSDFKPFNSGITAEVESIMVGHLIVPWLDNDNPCTLSSTCISFLRENIGYEGMIVTDDMSMLKSSGYDLSSAVNQAFIAGNDFLFIVTTDNVERREVMDNLLAIVEDGTITSEELDSKVVRVLDAKNKIVTTSERYVPAELIY